MIFNAEIFNALFVSYCMQNSPSIWTTLELMAVDVIQMMLSLRKMKIAHHKLETLSRQVEQESSWETRVLVQAQRQDRIGIDAVGTSSVAAEYFTVV